jgi:hypothetical protein
MQDTAPSPIVYPDMPRCRHRHGNVGEFPHTLESKLLEMKDWKQLWAQAGTKFKISSEILAVVCVASARGVVHIERHSSESQYAIVWSNI